ncbi:MAG: 50S ribosomal protein L18 [Crenarchaeota archaeon]|nr:50S ribosomal protein L18 [Thermoproteota archaeon]
MKNSSRYRVKLRRRREKKTDYQARKGFVVSGRSRLVARSSLKNTIAQIVVAKVHGDEVLASAHSQELIKKYGWKGATGNVPAAYLTGLLCGLKAKKNGVEEAILDLGLVSPVKGSKVFSTMAGVIDGGVEIPHNDEKILTDRISGEHIANYASELGTPEEFTPKFSQYLENKLSPLDLCSHFEQIKAAILKEYGEEYTPQKHEIKKPKPKPKAEVKAPPKITPPSPKIVAPATSTDKGVPATEQKVEPKPKVTAKAEPATEAPSKKAEKPAKAEKAEVKQTKAKAAKSSEKEAEVAEKPKSKAKAEKPAKAVAGKAKPSKAKSDAKSGGKKE